ncbi:Aste57867_10385 [Aphanomyces stellatus]|uniref:Aste57867_10385 protein n=1 Tax=Aphanomyces stellatus TaxID=120398 RepID=A0A485KQ77_9STRA|nr:hypothetical protein As57867_010345 [Aphanomyces stellatus]VFT87259.1 Aste57867_10385 [Aphanomyces stellatus]
MPKEVVSTKWLTDSALPHLPHMRVVISYHMGAAHHEVHFSTTTGSESAAVEAARSLASSSVSCWSKATSHDGSIDRVRGLTASNGHGHHSLRFLVERTTTTPQKRLSDDKSGDGGHRGDAKDVPSYHGVGAAEIERKWLVDGACGADVVASNT